MTDRIQRFPGAEKPHVTFDALEAAFIYLSVQAMLNSQVFEEVRFGEEREHAYSAMAKLNTLLDSPADQADLAKGAGFHAVALDRRPPPPRG